MMDNAQGESRDQSTPSVVLDFNLPPEYPIDDRCSARIDGFAITACTRIQLDATLAFFPLPLGKLTPEVERLYHQGWDSLFTSLRILQGSAAMFQPSVGVTENKKRHAIIPAAPQLLRLQELLAAINDAIPQVAHVPATNAPRGPARFGDSGLVIPAMYPQPVDRHLDYRTALQCEARAALDAVRRVEGLFGKFDVWVRNPEIATLEAIFRALRLQEIDTEDFLAKIQTEFLLPKDLMYRGLLARAVLPYMCISDPHRNPPWRSNANPAAWIKSEVRREARRCFLGAMGQNGKSTAFYYWSHPIEAQRTINVKQFEDRAATGASKTLKEQAVEWLLAHRELIKHTARRPQCVHVADFEQTTESPEEPDLDPWDLWSPDVAWRRGTRHARTLGAFYDPAPDGWVEIPWETVARHLPKRDAGTLLKIVGLSGNDSICRAISEAGYRSLYRLRPYIKELIGQALDGSLPYKPRNTLYARSTVAERGGREWRHTLHGKDLDVLRDHLNKEMQKLTRDWDERDPAPLATFGALSPVKVPRRMASPPHNISRSDTPTNPFGELSEAVSGTLRAGDAVAYREARLALSRGCQDLLWDEPDDSDLDESD